MDVRIAPGPRAKLQATGIDKAGRRQYLYHPGIPRAARGGLAVTEHLELHPLDPLYVCAVAIRLLNLAWFRVGSDRHTNRSRTYGVTTLRKSHVRVRGTRVTFRIRAKGRTKVRTALVDSELADAVRELLGKPGSRLFRYETDGELRNLSARRLNDYVQEYMGDEFFCKDFRTWGGTLIAAIEFAERGPVEGIRGAEARDLGRDAEGRRTARKYRRGCP